MNSEESVTKIVVIGGSGLIGSMLVTKLREYRCKAIAASPKSGVNTITGRGLAKVLEGASVVVDVSNSPSFEPASVMEFFTTSTRNLLNYEAAAGVKHHVALSIVGIERVSESVYYRAKVEQEKLITNSHVPYSIVRSTQFFEFLKAIAEAAIQGDSIRLAPVLIQPIAAADVASALGKVAIGAPLNGTVEIAGPEVFRLDELIRKDLSIRNDPRRVVSDPTARYFGGVLSETALIPTGDARLADRRFEDWIAGAESAAGTPISFRSKRAAT